VIEKIDFEKACALSGDIDLLVVDGMKSIDSASNIAASFFPGLNPGALIFHQDYLHFGHGWIHVLTWRLREYLKLVCIVPHSTAIFQLVKPIPREKCYVYDEFPPDTPDVILEAYQWNIALFGEPYRDVFSAAEIFLSIYSGYGKIIGLPKMYEAKRTHLDSSDAFVRMRKFLNYYGTNWVGKGMFD